ncbi:hypothetical protein [Flavobacterium sp.]|uniref:hypothetical protein n=1 Tax=Flavobacterium sp. TaxID=239 RepID=UPI003D0CDB72
MLLKKNGFILHPSSNGFEVLYNSSVPINTMLDYISKTSSQDYFEFNMQSSNLNFYFFTALPINWFGLITYTSHNNNNNNNNNGTITLLETLETKQSNSFTGNLKIYFEDLKKFLNNSSPVLFEIIFKARETQWYYYVINKNDVLLNNAAITEKGIVQFDGPTKVTLQTGEQALLFTSNNKHISLSEKPKFKFDLINTSGRKELSPDNINAKIIIKSLPVPDVSRMTIIQNSQGGQVVSPMYIYL